MAGICPKIISRDNYLVCNGPTKEIISSDYYNQQEYLVPRNGVANQVHVLPYRFYRLDQPQFSKLNCLTEHINIITIQVK